MTVRAVMIGCGAIAQWHLDTIERAGVPDAPLAEDGRPCPVRKGNTLFSAATVPSQPTSSDNITTKTA